MANEVNIVETKDALELHELGFKTDVQPKQELQEPPFWSAVAAEFWGMMLFIWISIMVSTNMSKCPGLVS